MHYTDLIKRAWNITWRYKVLWIFGILLALAGGGGGSGGGGSSGGGSGRAGMPPIPALGQINPGLVFGLVTLCCCLLVIWIIALTIVRYIALTALYRGVDQIEATGAAPTWREGFRLGWNNRAFRLWLLDLVVLIPFVVAAFVLLALGASPLLLLLIDNPVARGIGIALTIGLELLVIGVLIVAGILVSALRQFWSREVAIADRNIGEAIVTGYHLVRTRLKDVGVMWLLMAAIGLGVGIVMVPIFIAVIMLALAVGGGLGYALFRLTDSVLWAATFGLPPFLLIMLVPLLLIQGIYLVFESSTWTLTYREVAGTAEAGRDGRGGGLALMPPTALSGAQSDLVALPPDRRIFLEGIAGTGKTTAGVARLLKLLVEGVPAQAILVLTPQRTLATPYTDALRGPTVPAGGEVTVLTLGGLAQRMVELFWPVIAAEAGFARPDRPPTFLTLETAQYFMAQLVGPLLAEGYFDSLSIDRNRLYSQILDNLNKAAAVGFPHSEIGARLSAAWVGESVQTRVYAEAQECADRFRAYCLAHNLLDFSLQYALFAQRLWSLPACRDYLTRRYTHVIVDNVEEDTPVAHDLVADWLPTCASALVIYDWEAGYRRFLGADSRGAYRLKALCGEHVEIRRLVRHLTRNPGAGRPAGTGAGRKTGDGTGDDLGGPRPDADQAQKRCASTRRRSKLPVLTESPANRGCAACPRLHLPPLPSRNARLGGRRDRPSGAWSRRPPASKSPCWRLSWAAGCASRWTTG